LTTYRIRELSSIPTYICTDDGSDQAPTFDILKAIKKYIKPDPYTWENIHNQVSQHPSVFPYLEVDRTKMPPTRPAVGNLTFDLLNPINNKAHFGIADFYKVEEKEHRVEIWCRDSDENFYSSKNVKGHSGFPINKAIKVKTNLDGQDIEMRFPAYSSETRNKRT
jgi:hypothetical protein